MTREELMAAIMAGKIKKVRSGACPVCGKEFVSTHKHGRKTCGEANCHGMLRQCTQEVMRAQEALCEKERAQRKNFATEKAMHDARKAGQACAECLEPWLARYDAGFKRYPDPAWGF